MIGELGRRFVDAHRYLGLGVLHRPSVRPTRVRAELQAATDRSSALGLAPEFARAWAELQDKCAA